MPGPEAEVSADFEIVGDVITDDPQRDHDLRTPGPEGPALLAVDQGSEDLARSGLPLFSARSTIRCDPELSFERASPSSSVKGVTRAWYLNLCMPATTFGAFTS